MGCKHWETFPRGVLKRDKQEGKKGVLSGGGGGWKPHVAHAGDRTVSSFKGKVIYGEIT